MSDAKHSPPGDTSFLLSLGRHLGAAVGLIVLVAALFWAIGQLRAEPAREGLAIGEQPGPTTPSPTAAESPAPTSPDAADETTPSPAGDASPSPTLAPDATASPSSEQVPAGEISIQVLDAVRDDGGATAAEVAEALSAEGFDVIVTNRAGVDYDVTTVFWTQGQQAKARQVAAAMGYDTVDEQPGMLSESVDVHVVVGRDQR